MTKAQATAKREELFKIIEDLVQWENTSNTALLERARAAIHENWIETCRLNKVHPQAADLLNPDKLPAFHVPFATGGALPLEAQRLVLESWASGPSSLPKASLARTAGFGPVHRSSRACSSAPWHGVTRRARTSEAFSGRSMTPASC